MNKTKRTLLFIDKLEANDIGGMTTDIRKAEYILAVHKLSFDKILKGTSKDTKIPSGMFHTGKWIVAFNIDWNLTKVNFGLINYQMNLDENFDLFADTLSPKSVQVFFNLQQIVTKKSQEELDSVVLSDNNDDFEEYYQSYIDFRSH